MIKFRIKCITILLLVMVLCNFYVFNTAKAMVTVNETAPKFTITMLDGSTVQLSDYNEKLTVLIFGRALACSNTQFVIRMANSLAESFYADKVKFVVLEIDEYNKEINDYIEDNEYNNLAFSSDSIGTGYNFLWDYVTKCYGELSTVNLPATFIIDQNGYIRYCSTGVVTYTELQTALVTIGGLDILDPSMYKNKDRLYELNEKIYNAGRTDEKALNYYKEPTKAIQSDNEYIVELSNQITADITDDYDKIKAIHDWITSNIYYDYSFFDGTTDTTNFGAYDTMTNKYSVCQGFAELTAALIRAADIPCKLVIGYASGLSGDSKQDWSDDIITKTESNHAWNEAFVNGKWVILDTTWDTGNSYNTGDFHAAAGEDTYFDPDLEVFSMSHKIISSGSDYLIPEDIANLNIDSISNYIYTGINIIPKLHIMNGTYELIEGRDYSLYYQNNKVPGTATVTITGKGTFYGTKTIDFIIVPAKVTAVTAKSISDGVVKITWSNTVGVGGYQISYSKTKNGKYQVVGRTTKTTYTMKDIEEGGTYYIKVTAFKKINGKYYYGKSSTPVKITIK